MGAWGFITVASGKLELYVIYCLLFYAINFIIFHVKFVSFRTVEAPCQQSFLLPEA